MEIERDRKSDKICLMQKGYLQKVLQKFNINDDIKSVSILSALHFMLKTIMSPITIEEREYISHVPYATALGS